MKSIAIRGLVTSIVGILSFFSLVPQDVEEFVIDNAMQVIGGSYFLWTYFVTQRWFAKRKSDAGA